MKFFIAMGTVLYYSATRKMFSLPKVIKKLDPICKTDLDFRSCFERDKPLSYNRKHAVKETTCSISGMLNIIKAA